MNLWLGKLRCTQGTVIYLTGQLNRSTQGRTGFLLIFLINFVSLVKVYIILTDQQTEDWEIVLCLV